MAATALKLAANRANAAHSTGPVDTSRTRFNGLNHGLTSKQTVIPGENQEEYDAFKAGMLTDIRPGSTIETVLAERIVAAAWRLKRFNRVECAFFNNRIDAFLEENPDSDPDSALAGRRIVFHGHCHQKAASALPPTVRLLSRIPGVQRVLRHRL